jgi:TPR repeat protein
MRPSRLAIAAAMTAAGLLLASPAFALKKSGCPDEASASRAPDAAYALGEAYETGNCGQPYDEAKAAEWYRKAAEKNYAPAQYALGELYFTSGKNYPEAKKWFLRSAQGGDAHAALKLGYLNAEAHYDGLTPDYVEAEKWFTVAAEKNVEDARFRLGNFYANYKQPRDYDKAWLWLKKAAEGGHSTAMYDLSNLIYTNKVKDKTKDEALEWTRKAAEAGVVAAEVRLVEMYSTGKGTPQNAPEALKWILRMADAPQASTIWLDRAGDIFYSGWLGIPPNYPKALHYYGLAAEKGDRRARGRLGEMYTYGLGVPKDPEKARAYFKDLPHLLPSYDKNAAEQLNAVPPRTTPVPWSQKH